MSLKFNPFTGTFDFVGAGGGAAFDPHSPGPIGDTTPDTVDATVLTADTKLVLTALGHPGTDNVIQFGDFGYPTRIYSDWSISCNGINIGYPGVGAGLFIVNGTLNVCGQPLQLKSYTVGTLPSASPAGQKAFVTDSSVTIDVGIGDVVAGSGEAKTTVFSDGTDWIIG